MYSLKMDLLNSNKEIIYSYSFDNGTYNMIQQKDFSSAIEREPILTDATELIIYQLNINLFKSEAENLIQRKKIYDFFHSLDFSNFSIIQLYMIEEGNEPQLIFDNENFNLMIHSGEYRDFFLEGINQGGISFILYQYK